MKEFRWQEIKALLYRLFLCYIFFQIARGLFWWYNRDLISVESVSDYMHLAYRGMAFDTTAIFYINGLFLVFSLVPVFINTTKNYQKFLFWVYFVTNGIGYSMNFGDFVYYKFSQSRLTSAILDVVENESNLFKVFRVSILENFSIVIWYIVLMVLWVFLYKKVKVSYKKPQKLVPYFIFSILVFCISVILAIVGIRGDFKHSTRPINMVDATRHVENPVHGNIVLNSTFSFFRTISKRSFKETHLVDEEFVKNTIHTYKTYQREVPDSRPNIVIFIVESLGREYIGTFNEGSNIPNYESFTPFIDSLAKESLYFPNSFANGRQSIHGMSSVLAGIPALKDAFTSSPFANQEIQSIVSVCNELNYDTSFYHGAPNGSMGFLGFGNILGFDAYFGKTEYNNDADFDGIWAIWDEPFLQYFAKNVGKKQPFMTTVFTASSHHPFKIPKKYKGKFKKGYCDMHKPIQYTDYAIRKYFETAKKQPWFSNTIFVFTGDHTNQKYYDEYKKAINGFAVPVMFYSANPAYNLKGKKTDLAQQIDIYPTLSDLIGYNKPIRSWGRSLISLGQEPHFIISSFGAEEIYTIGNFRYRFNRERVTGVYVLTDLELKDNLMETIDEAVLKKNEKLCRAWYQDYMNRVVRRELK